MVQIGTIVRVFIASPSDVVDERDALVSVISKWNAMHTAETGVIIEPVRWETHASPLQGGRPQEQINRQLVNISDIFVGVFWTRLGSDTGVAVSGTVEELDQFLNSDRPALLYFSDKPLPPSSIDDVQRSKLKNFKEMAQQKGLYHEVKDLSQFREDVFGHLGKQVLAYVNKLKAQARDDNKLQAAAFAADASVLKIPHSVVPSPRLFSRIAEALAEKKIGVSEALQRTLIELEGVLPGPDENWIKSELQGYKPPDRNCIEIFDGTGEVYTANFPHYRQPEASDGNRTLILESVEVLEQLVAEKQALEYSINREPVSVNYFRLNQVLVEVKMRLLETLKQSQNAKLLASERDST